MIDFSKYNNDPYSYDRIKDRYIDPCKQINISDDYVLTDTNIPVKTYTDKKPIVLYLPIVMNSDHSYIRLYDMSLSWGMNNLIVKGNGNKIMNTYEDLICDLSGHVVDLQYINKKQGWIVL